MSSKGEARPVKNPYAPTNAPLLPFDMWAPGVEVLRDLEPSVRELLTDSGPLIRRAERAGAAAVAARLIEQRLGFLSREQQALLVAPASSCLVREVVLSGDGEAWVFAQSLVPDHTLEAHPWLAELGDASLCGTLASVEGVGYGAFEFAPLPAVHPLAARALAGSAESPAMLWARRRWVALRGRRLLMQEVFLPELVLC